MKKTTVALVLALVLLASLGQALEPQAEALSAPDIIGTAAPRIALITTASPSLNVSGTTASYSLSVICTSSVNSINATLQIQRSSGGAWQDYGASWSASSSTYYLSASGTKTVASGYTYRLKASITASDGSATASATVYS